MFQRFSCRDSAVASSETGCARVVVGLGVHVRVQAVKSRHSLVAVMLSYPFAFGDATFAFLGQSFEHFRSLIMPYRDCSLQLCKGVLAAKACGYLFSSTEFASKWLLGGRFPG